MSEILYRNISETLYKTSTGYRSGNHLLPVSAIFLGPIEFLFINQLAFF